MKVLTTVVLMTAAVLAASCRNLVPGGSMAPADRLAQAETLFAKGDVEGAQDTLSPLVGGSYERDRVIALQTRINELLLDSGNPATLAEVKEAEEREMTKAAEARMKRVRREIKDNRLDAAEELLAPLVGGPVLKDEVRAAALEIRDLKAKNERAFMQERTTVRALEDADSRLILPQSYGEAVVISRDQTPLEIPVGPMEDLVNKRVTIDLDNAGVKELVETLSEVDGLNVIADDALEEEKTLTLKVKDVPLKEVLSYVARNMGIAFHLGENIVWVTASTDPPGSGPKLETRIYRLPQGFIPVLAPAQGGGGGGGGGRGGGGGQSGALPPDDEDMDLEDALTAMLTDSPPGASFRIFRHRNLLVVKDSLENLRVVEELIREIDRPPYQVLIEARFLTITQKALLDLGTELTNTTPALPALDPNDPERIRLEDFTSLLGVGGIGADEGPGQITLGGVLGDRTYQLVITALERDESTKTLSAPRITVLNNHSARIRKGDVLYYFEEYDIESIDGGDQGDDRMLVPTGSPTELPLGITLDVKVNVGNDGETVMLNLKPELTTFIKWEEYLTGGGNDSDNNNNNNNNDNANSTGLSSIKLPRVNESLVTTYVACRSGETVVLGGMIEDSKTRTVRKVPLLGDIPFVGYLFSRRVTEENPQHLIIFVKATVVDLTGRFVQQTD